MKKGNFLIVLLVLLITGCNQSENKRVPGEPYIEIEGTKENGIHRKYNAQGVIESEIPYKDSKPHGIQKTYYKTGKLFRETPVEMGEINGVVKEYYASGKLYREMPTIKGKADGIVKKYYEDGKLMAEAPFIKGKPTFGLVEYDTNGNKIEHPKILFKPVNHIAVDGMFILELSFSDKNIKPEFTQILMFEKREISSILSTENGKGIFKIYVPKGNTLSKTLTFEAKYTTIRNNICIIRATYNLNVSN